MKYGVNLHFYSEIALSRDGSVNVTDSDTKSRAIMILVISSQYATLLCNLSNEVIVLNHTFLY